VVLKCGLAFQVKIMGGGYLREIVGPKRDEIINDSIEVCSHETHNSTTQYFLEDYVKKNETGKSCNTNMHVGSEKCIQTFGWKISKEEATLKT
jgi:hypothetical protein